MKYGSRPAIPLGLIVLLSGIARGQTFVDVPPDLLRARVVEVEPQKVKDRRMTAEGSIVTVEVSLPASTDAGFDFAEPYAFEFQGPGKDALPWVWERTGLPHAGRLGRAIQPGGTVTYQALVPFDKAGAQRARVRVLHAGGWAGLEQPSGHGVEIGRPEVVRSQVNQSNQTVLETHNPLNVSVDLVLRARFAKPYKVESLIKVTCEASSRQEHTVETLDIGGQRFYGPEFQELEVVDWSRAVDPRAEDAGRIYAALDGACYRWPADVFPVRALVTYRHESAPGVEPVVAQVLIRADGTVDARAQPGTKALAAESLGRFVEEHLWCTARPTAESVVAAGGLRLLRGGDGPLVLVETKGATTPGFERRVIEAQDGWPLRSHGVSETAGLRYRWEWTDAQEEGAPWRPAEVRRYWSDSPGLKPEVATYGWREFGGCWIPSSITIESGLSAGAGFGESADLSAWTFAAEAFEDRVLPEGALADEVRAAWDAFYRYPNRRATWTGHYSITHAGTDGVWRGYGRVEGEFGVSGITSIFWEDASARPTNAGMTPADKDDLDGIVLDRFLMWSNRDVCRFERFDNAFLGATMSRGDDGWIEIDGGPVAALRIKGGRPVDFRYGRGHEVAVTWKILRGQWVPTAMSSGEELVTVAWARVRGDWLVPKKMKFKDIFPDWGPETMSWSKVTVVE